MDRRNNNCARFQTYVRNVLRLFGYLMNNYFVLFDSKGFALFKSNISERQLTCKPIEKSISGVLFDIGNAKGFLNIEEIKIAQKGLSDFPFNSEILLYISKVDEKNQRLFLSINRN